VRIGPGAAADARAGLRQFGLQHRHQRRLRRLGEAIAAPEGRCRYGRDHRARTPPRRHRIASSGRQAWVSHQRAVRSTCIGAGEVGRVGVQQRGQPLELGGAVQDAVQAAQFALDASASSA
jgi:hypothetical protein